LNIIDLEIGQFATTKEWEVKNFYIRRKSRLDFSCYRNGILERNLPSISEDGSSWHSYFYKDDFELCDCNGKLIEEFTYPLYMESIQNGTVIKFVSLHSGIVIIQGKANDKPGHEYPARVKHNDYNIWKPCDFSKAPEIEDLDYWDARYNAGLPIYYTNKEGISSIIVAQKPSDYVKYQEKGTYKFYIQDESKPEFTYPMYFECIRTHANEGMIVKFETIEIGQIVKSGKKLGATKEFDIKSFTMHTYQQTWKQVNFDETICKIIPTQDDIDELISDLKSIIEDDDNRFSPSEYGAGTQLKESGYDQCHDLIDEWMDKYHITKAPDIDGENFRHFGDLLDIIMYIENTLQGNEPYEPIMGVDYASQPDIAFVPQEGIKSRLNDDALDAFSYAKHVWNYLQQDTGATEVANNLNQTKEFTMNNELKQAILELIAESKQLKVKKPKTPKIVCNVEGTLMEFADEAALKQFMWSSRVESVIRYDLAGKVTVPFELSVEAPKTKASK